MDNLSVTGNLCLRGEKYALEEIRSPKRMVTATCRIDEKSQERFGISVRQLPVKTSSPCPREWIPALLNDIYKIKVSLPVKAGDVLIANWKHNEEINVIATRTLG
jgi:CxxC motif-containing protein